MLPQAGPQPQVPRFTGIPFPYSVRVNTKAHREFSKLLWILLEWYNGAWLRPNTDFSISSCVIMRDGEQAFGEWLVLFVKPVLSWIQCLLVMSQVRKCPSVTEWKIACVCGPHLVISVEKLSHWLYDVTLATRFHCFESSLCFQKKPNLSKWTSC